MINQQLSKLDPKTIDPKWLPDGLQPVVAILGMPTLLELLDQRGGTKVNVPPVGSNWPNELKELLTAEQLSALSRDYGGLSIELPPPSVIWRNIRDCAIERDVVENKMGPTELARAHGISYRWAKKLRRRVLSGEQITQYRREAI